MPCRVFVHTVPSVCNAVPLPVHLCIWTLAPRLIISGAASSMRPSMTTSCCPIPGCLLCFCWHRMDFTASASPHRTLRTQRMGAVSYSSEDRSSSLNAAGQRGQVPRACSSGGRVSLRSSFLNISLLQTVKSLRTGTAVVTSPSPTVPNRVERVWHSACIC